MPATGNCLRKTAFILRSSGRKFCSIFSVSASLHGSLSNLNRAEDVFNIFPNGKQAESLTELS